MVKKTKTEPEVEEVPTMARIIAEINKGFGTDIIGRTPDLENIKTERISSGIECLDAALGGGFPMRRLVELFGLPSSGKSLISFVTIAEAQKKGLECVYIDAEDTFDPVFAQKLGVDTDKLIVAKLNIGEDILDTVCKLLAIEPAIIVVDSIGGMTTRAEFSEDADKQHMAPKARLFGRMLPKIVALNKNTLIIFINQLRATMAMYGPQNATPGGKTITFLSAVRVEVKKIEPLHLDNKKTEEIIGQLVGFNVVKNKTAPPSKTGSFKFFYEDGKIEES